jgi:fructose-1-phosphate kinase PfkB-like protein
LFKSDFLQKTLVLKNLQENEVNRSSGYYFDASGKGINVSRVLLQLGEPVVHLTQAGGVNKRHFLSLAQKAGILYQGVESRSVKLNTKNTFFILTTFLKKSIMNQLVDLINQLTRFFVLMLKLEKD